MIMRREIDRTLILMELRMKNVKLSWWGYEMWISEEMEGKMKGNEKMKKKNNCF